MSKKLLANQKVNKGYWDLIQDLIILPIALAYYFIGRFALAKTFYASSACTQCGLCEKQCGVKAIKQAKKRPFWTYKCESCMHCMTSCPSKAIHTGHGYVIGISLLYTTVLLGLFYSLLQGTILYFDHRLMEFIINNVLFILLLFIGYRFIHFFLRFKWFSRIIEFTSFTRYSFWGNQYKAMKDEDFSS